VVVVLLVGSIPYAHKASENASAFVRWQNQIEAIVSTEDIYLRYAYPNPPIMALLLYPLAKLPSVPGALLWYFLKAALAVVAIGLTFRLVECPARPFPLWAKWLVILLSIRPMLGDLAHGNVNLFILFLLIAALYAFQQGWDLPGGLVLALAVACKVTPALLLPYLLWKRAWRALVGCAVGLALFVAVIPGTVLGWQRNFQLLESWTAQMAAGYVASGKVAYTEHNNQSLPAVLLRLTTASPSFSTYVGMDHVPVRFDNVIELQPYQVQWLTRCLFVLFCGAVAWSCRTSLDHRHGWRLPAEFGLVLLGMLLFSERTWKHHCTTLLVPVAVIVWSLACGRLGTTRRIYLAGTLATVVALVTSTSTGLLPDELAKLAQVWGAYTWSFLLLAAALLALLRGKPDGERVGSDQVIADCEVSSGRIVACRFSSNR
jgi:hypothetical protein